ncbi:MAG: Gfo/Idh/MocA family oxidoreductase [Candidatus Hydrogenedentes bacterium]|nr:Gfo/Idh/MocA family oxidoreductase [Candidatus Hydrogenedentota bacterium]
MDVAIVGCGDRGAAYAAAAHRCGLTVSVCADVSERRARRLARVHNAASTIRCNMALRSKAVDAAIVTTPTPAHAEYVLSALRAGKPVLCEAPFTRTTAQGREIVGEVRKRGVVCHVANPSRSRPEYEAIEAQINAAKIGKVGYIRTYRAGPMPKGAGNWYRDYAQSGGVTLDGLVHDFDWISRQFGKVKKVFCQNLEHGGFDFSMVTLRLETGAIAQVIGSWAHAKGSAPSLRIELCGTGGMVQYDSGDVPVRTSRRSGGTPALGLSPVLKSIEESEIEQFIAATDGVGDPASAEDALWAVRVAEAALRSAKTGRAVRP